MLYHVVRIGRDPFDTFASTDRSEALDLAVPDEGGDVECATVEAPDAGAARLAVPASEWRRLFTEPAPSSAAPEQRYDFWHPSLPEVLVYRREPQAGGHICAKVAESAPYFRLLFNLSFALLLALAIPASAQEPCKVNVATCVAAQCAFLPGIGPSKGAAIVAAHPVDEKSLDAVAGIGEATLAKIRPHVAYTGETTCTSKQTAPKQGKDGAE